MYYILHTGTIHHILLHIWFQNPKGLISSMNRVLEGSFARRGVVGACGAFVEWFVVFFSCRLFFASCRAPDSIVDGAFAEEVGGFAPLVRRQRVVIPAEVAECVFFAYSSSDGAAAISLAY